MSERIAIIERCGQCEHGNPYSVPLGRCNHEAFAHLSRHKVVNLKDPPPGWCPLPRGPVYQIKPLEWRDIGHHSSNADNYTVYFYQPVCSDGEWRWKEHGCAVNLCESLEAGKAACEAEHRARIAAALVEVKP